ncbi:uncharacterized protein ACNS7B_020902 [Menidia menidia]
MAQVGKIDDFRPDVEPWTAYIERLEQYLEANDVDEEKHVAVLLSVMGAKAYGLLRNLVQPGKPKDKTFGEIVDILKEHYEPKPILVAERFRFNRCNQKTSQTVAQYVAELKQQAANCDFGASLDSALRDRFVSGIKNEACQRRLLSEDRLTFAKAFEIALNMETADRDTRQLRGAESEWSSEASVHKYRVTPNCTTGQSPADVFLRRHIRTRLDFIKPNTKETVRRKQYRQKAQHDFTAVDRSFSVDDAVYLRNTGGGVHKWIPGQVVRQTGPVSYEVKERYSNTVHRRHGDQLRTQAVAEPDVEDSETPTQEQKDVNITPKQSDLDSGVHPPVSPDPSVILRRSTRTRKTPKRYHE